MHNDIIQSLDNYKKIGITFDYSGDTYTITAVGKKRKLTKKINNKAIGNELLIETYNLLETYYNQSQLKSDQLYTFMYNNIRKALHDKILELTKSKLVIIADELNWDSNKETI